MTSERRPLALDVSLDSIVAFCAMLRTLGAIEGIQ